MTIYAVNLALAALMTYLCHKVFPEFPLKAGYALLAFLFWHFVFWLISFFYARRGHFAKLPRIYGLFFYYIKELALASLSVAREVVTPSTQLKPGIIAFRMTAESDIEIVLLANMLTLTPGSLSIDVSDDRKTLYVHDIHIKNLEIEKREEEWRNGMEKRILRITRP